MTRLSLKSPPAALTLSLSLILALLIGFGGFIVALLRTVFTAGSTQVIPAFTVDDRIYNILIASPTICLQNLTSTLNEGGCRVQLLWSFSHSLYHFDSPALAAIGLRLILLIGIGIALFYFNRAWCRQTDQNPNRTMLWLCGLLVFIPFPLMLLGFGRELTDASLVYATIASPSDLFSILMTIVCLGGLYINRENTRTWPLLGLLAGAWALIHPYYIFYWLTIIVAWALISGKSNRLRHLRTSTLILPTLLAGAYYAWLGNTNEFFRNQLATNITLFEPKTLLPLLIGIIIALILAALTLRKDQITRVMITRAIDPYLGVWLTVSTVWQLIPVHSWRRSVLILLLPLTLTTVRLANLTLARHYRKYILAVLATNVIILIAISYEAQSQYLAANLRPVTVTATDRQTAHYLENHPQQSFIGSHWAVMRFPWLSRTRMLNVQPPESPNYHAWNNLLRDIATPAFPCNLITQHLKNGRVSGVILDRTTMKPQIDYFAACRYKTDYQNADWVIVSP